MQSQLPDLTVHAHRLLTGLTQPVQRFQADPSSLFDLARGHVQLMPSFELPCDYELFAVKTFQSSASTFTGKRMAVLVCMRWTCLEFDLWPSREICRTLYGYFTVSADISGTHFPTRNGPAVYDTVALSLSTCIMAPRFNVHRL